MGRAWLPGMPLGTSTASSATRGPPLPGLYALPCGTLPPLLPLPPAAKAAPGCMLTSLRGVPGLPSEPTICGCAATLNLPVPAPLPLRCRRRRNSIKLAAAIAAAPATPPTMPATKPAVLTPLWPLLELPSAPLDGLSGTMLGMLADCAPGMSPAGSEQVRAYEKPWVFEGVTGMCSA